MHNIIIGYILTRINNVVWFVLQDQCKIANKCAFYTNRYGLCVDTQHVFYFFGFLIRNMSIFWLPFMVETCFGD